MIRYATYQLTALYFVSQSILQSKMSGATQTSDHLRKFLECPICFEVKRGFKIFQCKNGHVACEACYTNLTTCAECRVGLTHPGMRNLQMEKLLESLPQKCRHFEAGCLFQTIKGNSSLQAHKHRI
jgi:hypothetical protein